MKIIQLDRADRHYERELNEIVDRIFSWAGERGWGYRELADHARLSVSTTWYLQNRTTKLPQFRTVWKLCRAVGARIEILEPRVKARAEG